MSGPGPTDSLAAVLLAGGKGTRLGGLYPNLPKPMVPCAGRPFLDWVIDHFAGAGVRRFCLSTGHLGEVIRAHYGTQGRDGLEIRLVQEPGPLGTGGGIRLAWDALPAETPIVAANGDSLVAADLRAFAALAEDAEWDGAILAVETDDAARYGTLEMDDAGRLLGFREKRPGRGWINAGVYLFKPALRRHFPEGACSLEHDVFPAMLGAGARLRVHRARAPFLDIGTPESLREAEAFLRTHFAGRAPAAHGAGA